MGECVLRETYGEGKVSIVLQMKKKKKLFLLFGFSVNWVVLLTLFGLCIV